MTALTYEAAVALIHGEALCLDERRWDDWLAYFTEDAVYWVPAWKSETEATDNPDTELSLIYYQGREGLADRIWRLKSGQSVASNPLRRTAHVVGGVVIAESSSEDEPVVKASGAVHIYDPARKTQGVFFGRYEYRLREVNRAWKIGVKIIWLMNDNIPSVLDFYML